MSSINIKQFFSASYIFEKNPPYESSFLYVIAFFGLLVLIAFLSWYFFEKKNRKLPLYRGLQKGTFNLFFYTGLVGLILSFFHWQEVQYLGSRFFFAVLLVTFLIFGLNLVNYRLRVFPKKIKKYNEKKEFDKYLPANARR